MKISIVTINYNSSENTIKLLESLRNQTDKDFEVIVIDNNSKDVGQLMDYKTSETNIIFINNDKNLGYSGGNNVGIRRALETWKVDPAYDGASWVFFLNNDTWVESSFMERLKADLEGREGIVGLALDEGHRMVMAGLIEWLKPTLIHITMSDIVSNNDVRHRYYSIGGAMLIHKNVFDKIGFLDENYFLYFEDADFCQRAQKAGIPIFFLPTKFPGRSKAPPQEPTPKEIKIYHSVSASTKKLGSPLLLRYHYRNALYFNLKNGPFYVKVLIWPWSWIIVLKQIVKIALNKNKMESKEILFGVVDFYRNKVGKIKTGTLASYL